MTTLSAGDLTNLRSKQHEATVYASILKPDTILSAQVNDGAIAHGARTIAYDTGSGTFALCGPHQTLWIGSSAGAHDKGEIRIKSISGTASSGTIIVAENSINWADDDYLTIKHDYEAWPILPDFDPATGVFTKDTGAGATGETYTDENEDTPPVCIAGPHRAREYTGSNIVFDIDLSNSYAIADGASISSYAAVIAPSGAGATVTVNGGTGLGDVTATQKGQWWVKFTATDSNGKTQDTYRSYNTNSPDINLINNPLQGSWPRGYTWSLDFHGDSDELSDIPDGALCVLWYDNKLDGTSGYVDIWNADITGDWDGHITYGYLRTDRPSTSYETGAGIVSLNFTTPEALLDAMSEYGSIDLEAVTSPTKWYEFDAANLTVGTASDHILRWHSTAHLIMDLYGFKDNTDLMQYMQASEGSLLQRVNSLGWQKGIFAYLVSDRLGRLHFVRDSQMQNDTDRAALDTVFTLSPLDISGDIDTPRQPEKRTLLTNLDGFSFDATSLTSTPFLALAPGTAPEPHGTGKQKQSGQVLADQTDANERSGRLHSVANNEFGPWPLNFRGNYLGAFDIVPSLGFYNWGLTDNTLKRNLPLNGSKLICRSVQHSYDENGNIQTSATFEVEAPSFTGQTETYPSAPGCKPGQGSTTGVADPTPGDEEVEEAAIPPTVLAVFSSTTVSKRQFNVDNDWSTIATDTGIEHGKFDPYWPRLATNYNPANMRYSFSGAGLLKDAIGQTGTPTSSLPASAPPNTWSDATPPTTANVTYLADFYDLFVQGDRYFLVSYQHSGNWRGWILKRSSLGVESYLPLFDGALPDQVKPIWIAIACNHVLVTSWHDLATDKLKLLSFTKSSFAFAAEYDLGDTTQAALDAYQKWAFPVATPDFSAGSPDTTAPFIAAGIMVDPVGLSGTKYVLEYNGSSWNEIEIFDENEEEEEMYTDWIGSLVAGPANTANGREYWAFRQGIDT